MSNAGTSSAWSRSTASPADAGPNRYGVAVEHLEEGWRVRIVNVHGTTVSVRACRDEGEARLYASTVRQHIEWLSEPAFERYYAIEGS